jgi:hypothetical protein
MAESNGSNERELGRELTATHVEQIDKMMPSPSDRARMIWIELQKASSLSYISNWDLVCFSVEILGKFSTEFPWLQEAAKQASGLVYKAHYLNHDQIRQHEVEIIGAPKVEDMVGKEVSMFIPEMTKDK